jgi:ubiquitin-conjugating enzyme E2 S
LRHSGYFTTKIFHPNISASGEICVNTLKKDWAPTHGIRHILMVVRCLLIAPFPESALNEEAAKMLLEQYEEYFRRAKMLTGIHAAPRRAAGAASGSASGAVALAAGGSAPPAPDVAGGGAAGGAGPMSNATNTLGAGGAGGEAAAAAAAACGGGGGDAGASGREGPPLKKLDRKKSLKRL